MPEVAAPGPGLADAPKFVREILLRQPQVPQIEDAGLLPHLLEDEVQRLLPRAEGREGGFGCGGGVGLGLRHGTHFSRAVGKC